MYTLSAENEKKIRRRLDVICGLDAASGVTGTIGKTGRYSALTDKIQDIGIVPKLADLAGDGFPLDGSRICYEDNPEDPIKYGIQSASAADEDGNLTQGLILNIEGNMSDPVGEVTLCFDEVPDDVEFTYGVQGVSTVTAKVKERIYIDGTGGTDITVTIRKWTPGKRAKISRIFMGKCYQFNNDNLVSCILTLRAGLTLDPALPLSEIEINGHITDDISEEIPYIPDNSREYVKIIDNLLRWRGRRKCPGIGGRTWEISGRNTTRNSRRTRSNYHMQVQSL